MTGFNTEEVLSGETGRNNGQEAGASHECIMHSNELLKGNNNRTSERSERRRAEQRAQNEMVPSQMTFTQRLLREDGGEYLFEKSSLGSCEE